MKRTVLIQFFWITFLFSINSFAQYDTSDSTIIVNKPKVNNINAVENEIIFSDGTNNLIRITDEGNFGAIELSSGIPSIKNNKLYNFNGSLYFGDSVVGSGSSEISELNDLQDVKFDGQSLFIGEEAGILDDGGNSDGSKNFNTGVGKGSLRLNVIGSYNASFGYNSLFINSLGNKNTSVGYQNLFSNIDGSKNSALGYEALYSNSSGIQNTAIGSESMYLNLQGSNNSAFGFQSMYNNFFGNNNIGIGGYSNFFNKDGNNNTIIGYEAGKGTSEHNKSGNVFLGFQAGYNEIESNKLYIENSSSNQPLIYGDFENDSLKIYGDLYVDGNIIFNNDNIIPQNLNDLNDAKTTINSIFLGNEAGFSNALTTENIGIGHSAVKNNFSGNYNVAIGNYSNSENVDGSKNTIIGHKAGFGISGNSNSGNVLIGYKAGYFETGSNKLYINNDSSNAPLIWGDFTNGSEKVKVNGNLHVTGNISADGLGPGLTEIDDIADAKYDGSSLFLGFGAGTSDDGNNNFNTGVGHNSLNTSISGERNTAFGSFALSNNTNGNYNSAFGTGSLNHNSTGDKNTSIGYRANFYNEGGSNNTIIGYEAGYGSTLHDKNGNVFIGFQAGYNELGNNKLYINNDSSSIPLIWGDFTDGSERVVINGNGSSGLAAFNFYVNGTAGGMLSWNNLSDIRLKKDITTISNALEKVMNLRGVKYKWKDSDKYNNKTNIGFIAQEVEKVLPEVVKSEDDYYTMQYAPVTALLVEAMKKQQLLIKNLTQRIEELENNK